MIGRVLKVEPNLYKVKTEEGYKDALLYEYLRSTEGLKPYTGKGKWVCIKDRKII